jgi:hypothetical protein
VGTVTRNRASAKQAGARFERLIADALAIELNDSRIDRRVRYGAKDRGDVAGVYAPSGGRLVLELKDVARTDLSGWVNEAETERGNDDAHVALVIAKRRGTADPGDQIVAMTLRDLITLTTGERP